MTLIVQNFMELYVQNFPLVLYTAFKNYDKQIWFKKIIRKLFKSIIMVNNKSHIHTSIQL